MAKYTLQEVLDSTSKLSSGMLVSCALIPEMEVVGYLNSCFDEEMMAVNTGFNSQNQYRGIINHAAQNQIVCSNYLYQIMLVPGDKDILTQGIVSPIYKDLIFAKAELSINVDSLELPSLRGNSLYKKIRSRVGTGVFVDNRMLRKADFPENIQAEEGKAIMHIQPGDLLCQDKRGDVKSVGRNILALCRYVHAATGNLCYAQFELTELYTITDLSSDI